MNGLNFKNTQTQTYNNMKKTENIIFLFKEGKSKREIIELGFKRNTVHQVVNKFIRQQKKCTSLDTQQLVESDI
jgi:hypothetical protein